MNRPTTQTLFAFLALALSTLACDDGSSGVDDVDELDDTTSAGDEPGFRSLVPSGDELCEDDPGYVPPDSLNCNNPEANESRPPDPRGFCDVDIELLTSTFETGQGISEGRGEISVKARVIDVGNNVASIQTPTLKYNVGQTQGHYERVATVRVPVGATEPVKVCADFTEYDSGLNGHDDHASGCRTVLLSCTPTSGPHTQPINIGPEDFCGPNVCLGSASAALRAIRADADGDCVPNEDDFTPEPCDEAHKATQGVGLLLYHYYDNNDLTQLFQSASASLAKNMWAYDYVVLVMNNQESNTLGLMDAALAQADVVLEPTRDGVIDAMQMLTAEGYRFDVFVHGHGSRTAPDDAAFGTLTGGSISGQFLEDATDPSVAGTPRGGVPIVAVWSTSAWASRVNDSWDLIGSIVASGAFEWNFHPMTWNNFWDDWVATRPYREAVDGALTSDHIGQANTYVALQGVWNPYFCTGGNSILYDNACAENFFNDSLGANPAKYDMDGFYDVNASGADNMLVSSEREFVGDEQATFSGGANNWP